MCFPFSSPVDQSDRSSCRLVGPSSRSSFSASAALVSRCFEFAICSCSSVSQYFHVPYQFQVDSSGFHLNPLESTGISKRVFSFCFSLVYSNVVQFIPVHSSPFQSIPVHYSPFQFILVLFFYIINCSKLLS